MVTQNAGSCLRGSRAENPAMRGHALAPAEVGKWLRTQRQRRRMTQRELGTRIYLHQSMVSRLESGDVALSLELLKRVSIVFGIDPAAAYDILYGEDYAHE